jgi:hypothetical protein
MSGQSHVDLLLVVGLLLVSAALVVGRRYARDAARRQSFRLAFGDRRAVALGAVVAGSVLGISFVDGGFLPLAVSAALVLGAFVAAVASAVMRRVGRD